VKNLPKQDCQGPFCPFFDGLSVYDHEIIGKVRGIRFVDLPAHMFAESEHVGEVARESGARLKVVLGS